MKFSKTNRGFALIEFTDDYGEGCSLQKSSAAEDDFIWLGIDDPKPIVLATAAHRLGVQTSETTGWVPYPIPDEVSIHTRMHLSREQAKELAKLLHKFARTGEVPTR